MKRDRCRIKYSFISHFVCAAAGVRVSGVIFVHDYPSFRQAIFIVYSVQYASRVDIDFDSKFSQTEEDECFPTHYLK